MKKEVGYRIRKLRESKDLSQQNMADELAISHGAYSKIERGETDPSIGRLKQIADILKVTVSDLVQENTVSLRLDDKKEPYGFASKKEIEELTKTIDKIKVELDSLKKDITTLNTAVKKGKVRK